MKKRTSIIWLINKEKLQGIIDQSNSLVDVIKALGLCAYNGNHKTLNNRIKEDSLSLDKLTQNRKENKRTNNKKHISKILVSNSTYSRQDLKRRLIKENLVEYKCALCNNNGEWNNQKLVLQLDHINGINNDNRLENLRFLCPNCHSQTDTYCSKNPNNYTIPVYNNCIDCNSLINKTSTRCVTCSRIYNSNKQPLKFDVTKEELQELVSKHAIIQIGRMFGVSDNAIRKRCIKLNIDYKQKS